MTKPPAVPFISTLSTILSLLLAIVIGLVCYNWLEMDLFIIPLVDFFGKLWVIGLLLLAIPLSTSYLVYAILAIKNTQLLGKIGGYSLGVHTLFMLLGLSFSLGISFLILELFAHHFPAISLATSEASTESLTVNSTYFSWNYIIDSLAYCQNVLGQLILFLVFFAIIFSLFIAKFSTNFSALLLEKSKWLSQKSMQGLQYLLYSLPIAIFALVFPMVAQKGLMIVGVAGVFVVLVSGLLMAFILLLYLLVFIGGGDKHFAKKIFPSQIIAVSTRSTLATMPSIMRDATLNLGISNTVTAVIIPLFVTLFRINHVLSGPFRFLFLVYIFQLDLNTYAFFLFILVQIVTSFGSPGIPGGDRFAKLPLFVAAGIPLEGYILLKAVDDIPDIFMTLVNVTEIMAVTAIIAHKTKDDLVASDTSITPQNDLLPT